MCARSTLTHKSIVFHTNSALDACAVGNHNKALKHLAYLESKVGDRELHQAYVNLVRAFLEPEPNAATKYFVAVNEHFKLAENVQGQGVALLGLSRLAHDEHRALAYAEDACAVFRKLDDQVGLSKALSNVGASCIRLQKYPAAEEALQRAIALHERAEDNLGAGLAMLNLSTCFAASGKLQKAQQYSIKCIELMEKAELVPRKGLLLTTCQWRTTGWVPAARRCEHYLAKAFVNFGGTLRHLGAFDQAIAAYLKADNLMRTEKDDATRAIIANHIGETLRLKGDNASAETFFLRSRDLYEAAETRGYEFAVAVQSLGEIHAASGDVVKATRNYKDALHVFRQCDNRHAEAEVYLLMGELHITTGNNKEACRLLRKGFVIGVKISAVDIVVRANRGIGSAMMHVDSAVARECLKKALLQATEHGMKMEQMQIHRELSSCYKLANDPWAALSHLEQFVALRDEIFTEQADRQLRNNEILHNVEQYRDRVRTLELANEDMRAKLVANERMFAELFARIMEKQAFVNRVEGELGRLAENGPAEKAALAAELLKLIRTFGDTEQDRARLAEKFLLVHQNLLAKLLALAPDMTATELQVCVLTRLTMTAKDIAPILDISAKVVSNHCDSIRRKVKLAPRENLKTFLLRLDVGADATTGPEA